MGAARASTIPTMAKDTAVDDDAPAIALADGVRHELGEWEAATAAVLRKSRRLAEDAPDSDVWGALTTRTLDGIAVPPLGIPEHAAGLPDAGLPGQAPFTRGTAVARPEGAWDIRAQFGDPDPVRTAQHLATDLDNGVNSLWLAVGDGEIAVADLASLLEPVLVDLAPVVIDAPGMPVEAAQELAAVLQNKGIGTARGTSFGVDPIGNALRGFGSTDLADVTAVSSIAAPFGAFVATVDGTAVHDLGGSDVQELAYLLAAGAAYLRLLTGAGRSVDDAAGALEFRLAVTDEQLPSIAKLRVARRLWARVLELSGVAPQRRGQTQHAVTSRPMMTRYDPYVNMLRTTVAAFAAGAGGADSVTVLPFDEPLGLPEPFSRRIARNTSSLLLAESHVGAVVDPAGGAHAVEQLTDDLARSAWVLFGEFDAAAAHGGPAGFLPGLRGAIDETASARARQIATRERPITGVSEFPLVAETVVTRRPYAHGRPEPHRYAAEFETLRDVPAPRPVFLATLGPVAQHTARATFASNLLTAGGIDVVAAGATGSVEDLVAAYDTAESPAVVCLAGADAAYRQWGGEAVTALRAAGARWVVIAGRADSVDVPVDDAARVGVDALAFLRRIRSEVAA